MVPDTALADPLHSPFLGCGAFIQRIRSKPTFDLFFNEVSKIVCFA